METQIGTNDANLTTGKRRTREPRGRKDSTGQEQTKDLGVLKDAMPGLVALHKKTAEAKKTEQEAILKKAKESGFLAPVVASFVKAASRDAEAFEAEKLKTQQRSLLFDEIPQ